MENNVPNHQPETYHHVRTTQLECIGGSSKFQTSQEILNSTRKCPKSEASEDHGTPMRKNFAVKIKTFKIHLALGDLECKHM